MAESRCHRGANPFIERFFNDCVYDERDMVGFALGMGSIACWLVAQVPQLVKNHRLQSAEALSPFFLAEWLLGDTTNLVGALIKGDQPQTVVLTAEYFICMDCILLLQYLYYTSVARRRERTYALVHRRRRHHHRHHHQHHQARQISPGSDDQFANCVQNQQPSLGAFVSSSINIPVLTSVALMSGCFLLLINVNGGGAWGNFEDSNVPQSYRLLVGTIIGYFSSVLYLISRISQIFKNASRRSAEGLASSMFAFAMSANLFYGGSILVRSRSQEELASSLPWLIGSLGTVVLDAIIIFQAAVLFNSRGISNIGAGTGRQDPQVPEVEEALLASPPPLDMA